MKQYKDHSIFWNNRITKHKFPLNKMGEIIHYQLINLIPESSRNMLQNNNRLHNKILIFTKIIIFRMGNRNSRACMLDNHPNNL